MTSSSRFAGKVAIVTGSSNGIGRATAILLGREGAKVTITGRNSARLQETNNTLLNSGVDSEKINVVVGDLNDVTCQNDLVESTLKKFQKIDILFIHYTFYGAAKAGLDQLTRSLALELIEHGVRVNSVSPGLIDTGFLTALGLEDKSVANLTKYFSEHRDCIPVGKAGSPEDVAKLIAFLADRKLSSFIIGQSIVIDGGSSLVLGMTSHDLSKVLCSSNGIGRATAVLLAREGAKVTITGRNSARLEETRQEILKAGVPEENILAVSADVATEGGQDELIAKTIEKFGRLDILVNNAGATFRDAEGRTGLSQDISVYDKVMQINLKSVVTLTQKAKAHLIEAKGEVVNVSSIFGGEQAHPDVLYYAMSKTALNQFTRSAAIDLIKDGMLDFWQSHRECLPCKKIANPIDIANVIAFLADRNLSSYIIGQSIVADGGTSLMMGAHAHNMNDILGQ
uniref:3-oxoacyl-[acyl-carrier-protein] reductase n=1 Tax=Caenorhabditis japonica TaxID=281687 RepID=A0A8R1HHY4_CAEJA